MHTGCSRYKHFVRVGYVACTLVQCSRRLLHLWLHAWPSLFKELRSVTTNHEASVEALQRIVAAHDFDTGEPAIELPDAVLRQLNNEFFKKMKALRSQFVYPVLVFDGKPMPTKDATRRKRKECAVRNITRDHECDGLRCATFVCFALSVSQRPASRPARHKGTPGAGDVPRSEAPAGLRVWGFPQDATFHFAAGTARPVRLHCCAIRG